MVLILMEVCMRIAMDIFMEWLRREVQTILTPEQSLKFLRLVFSLYCSGYQMVLLALILLKALCRQKMDSSMEWHTTEVWIITERFIRRAQMER